MSRDSGSTIIHTISVPGFKYDLIKGFLLKGSKIAKEKHPLEEVERFKEMLKSRKVLKDQSNCWILKKDIKTGVLMALNLNSKGEIVRENPYKQDVIISSVEAERIAGKLPEKNVCPSDSDIVMKSIRDSLKLEQICIIDFKKDFLIHHGDKDFGADEKFALSVLQRFGIVSKNARHGNPLEKEADIVDEQNCQQYEVVFEFKTELSKRFMNKGGVYHPNMQLIQLVDNPFIHPSRALITKINEKEYTNKYSSNLVIINFGTKQTTKTMLEKIAEQMKNGALHQFRYSNLYIIAQDFINEQGYLFRIFPPRISKEFECKNEEVGFVERRIIQFCDMEDETEYLMLCRDIFNMSLVIRSDTGKELKKWIKQLRILTPKSGQAC